MNGTEHTLPFGKHKGVPLGAVPTSYLTWIAGTVKLSSGLGAAVRAELANRGVTAPDPPASPLPECQRCGAVELRASWQVRRDGEKVIRADCSTCGRFVAFLPKTPANRERADAGTDPAALLTFLIALGDAGIEVQRDGDELVYTPSDRMTPVLRALERQCGSQLREMLIDEHESP